MLLRMLDVRESTCQLQEIAAGKSGAQNETKLQHSKYDKEQGNRPAGAVPPSRF